MYDDDVTLNDTWKAMEELVDRGRCSAIGLADVNLGKLKSVYDTASIKPAVIYVVFWV